MQTKLDMWSSRDLTIFGRAMLIKTLGISQLIYSASNLDVPKELRTWSKQNLLSSSVKIKKIKLKDQASIKILTTAEYV